ncbi:MAG: transglutaminase domain-containing protein [Planctomycetota bacterium]|nr:transglutaminase domain-containing protein [Planctomycetota bacterium]
MDKWICPEYQILDKTLPSTALLPIEAEYEKVDGYCPETYLPLLKNRNIPKGYAVNPVFYQPCKRDTALTAVSIKFGDHKKDYDYIVKKRNEILHAADIPPNGRDIDKVRAIAFALVNHRRYNPEEPEVGFGYYLHPVDFMDKISYCAGAAKTMVAMCSTMNIPAREISMYCHCVCEVFIDGKWRFVENTVAALENIPDGYEKGPLFSYSFQELLVNPKAKGFGRDYYLRLNNYKVIKPDGKETYTFVYGMAAYSNWMYNLPKGYKDKSYKSIWLGTNSALGLSAFYPGETVTYKCGDKPIMYLTPARRKIADYIITADDIYQQKFYLDHKDSLKRVTAYLLMTAGSARNVPKDGGEWHFKVNGKKFYLKDIGGFKTVCPYRPNLGWEWLPGDKLQLDYVKFDVPIDVLDFE